MKPGFPSLQLSILLTTGVGQFPCPILCQEVDEVRLSSHRYRPGRAQRDSILQLRRVRQFRLERTVDRTSDLRHGLDPLRRPSRGPPLAFTRRVCGKDIHTDISGEKENPCFFFLLFSFSHNFYSSRYW